MVNLKNKNIWLVGGSTGIGASLSKMLGLEVNSLYVSARNGETLDKLVKEIKLPQVKSQVCDITSQESIEVAYNNIIKSCNKLDVLIINAAIYDKTDVLEFNYKTDIDQMLVNYVGSLKVLSPVLKHFVENKAGHIVVVSSQSAFRALPNAGGYGASKAALSYYFESLRMAVEDLGISVSIIYPGFVRTRLTDKNDFEMPFLLESDDAANRILSVIKKGYGDLGFPFGLAFPIQVLRLLPEKIYRIIMKKFFMTGK